MVVGDLDGGDAEVADGLGLLCGWPAEGRGVVVKFAHAAVGELDAHPEPERLELSHVIEGPVRGVGLPFVRWVPGRQSRVAGVRVAGGHPRIYS
ncbi:hypothetical protein L1785_20515 [Antribacter sp. KLBMP9083]|uniref:Uncharacterized protein n=1 Tax=Antribacter soli TaxID=2910976 RepID=A0AA41QJS9_9MICO|nr:hypothetical protein [Antribacter soli]MCF4123354.1 hypothetical protein [Antribacter soli]